MRIERHVFGSYSGYTTLAKSPGVSSEDCRSLEAGAYGFGQCNDRGFTRGLAKNPAYFTRLLGGARRGLTRVFEGKSDDNDRPTLCLVTIIFAQRDWDSLLWGDVAPLLENAAMWDWDGTPHMVALDLDPGLPSKNIPKKSVSKLLALLSEVERNFTQRRSVSVSSDDYSLLELRAIEMLVPVAVRRQFTTSYRSLSGQLPVSVNCVAEESGAHPTFRYQPDSNHFSPYAQYLAATELAAGQVPVDKVASYRSFGAGSGATETRVPQAPQPQASGAPVRTARRLVLWPVFVALAFGLIGTVVCFFLGQSLGWHTGNDSARARYELDLAHELSDRSADYEARLQKGMDVPKGTFDEMLAASEAKVAASEAKATASHAKAAEAVGRAAPVVKPVADTMPSELIEAREEKEKLRSAYEALAQQERDRFIQIQKEMDTILRRVNARRILDEQANIARIAEDVKYLQDDWPLLGEDGKKWLGSLHDTKERIANLADAAQKLGLVEELLQSCHTAKAQFMMKPGAAPHELVRNNLPNLKLAIADVPDWIDHPVVGLKDFKEDAEHQQADLQRWLYGIEHPPPPPSNDGGTSNGHGQRGQH